ncbi:MAG: transglycosylase domain-containing protein [Chloroflexota bacterium]
MPDMADIVHRRRERRADSRRRAQSRVRAAGLGLGYIFSILLALSLVAAALFYADLTRGLPSVEQVPLLLNPPDGLLLQPTRVYDRTGQILLYTFASSESPRRYIPLDSQNPEHLPKSLANATIAVNDPGFWNHAGYLLTGLDNPEQHPTLAQRLVAELLLWNEPPSFRRAARERILAAQLTARYGREQILEWTLNSANYGRFAFGADSAAELYFGTSASNLTLSQSAVLAAVSQSPSLNPLDAPAAASQRGREVIHAMRALDLISEEEANAALSDSPSPVGRGDRGEGGGAAPAFVNLVMTQLGQVFDRARLERGGLSIITTLDFDLQNETSCALQIYAARLAGAQVDAAGCESARLLPALPPGTAIPDASASAIIIDPNSGQILALVGETIQAQETVILTAHDSGSLLAPFVYLTGFTRGLGPASLVWDIPGEDIQNPDGQYHGPQRIRLALANDYLVPAAGVLEQMGAENVWRTAASFGVDYAPATRLFEQEAPLTLLDAAAAYGVFAAQGLKNGQTIGDGIQPAAVLRVETLDHAVWLDWSSPEMQAVVTPQLAYLMNHVLSDEIARWPGWGNPNVLEIGIPAAAKPGWTNGTDAWLVGYTPERVVAVWTGSRGTPLPSLQGGDVTPRLPAVLWSALMQAASRGLPADGWAAPVGVTTMEVCNPSGLLPTRDCPEIVSEVFLNGSEPTQADNLYRAIPINRETGFLATVFTPPELVEERVFLAVPPEARAWAESAGVEIPPDTYDVIQPSPVNPNAHITSPSMFAEVSGRVTIIGTAGGDGFQYYRVQAGKGLNPQEWLLLGGDVSAPVGEGVLAEWDTTGLNGLYAVQLVVVYADERVETATIQVTISP